MPARHIAAALILLFPAAALAVGDAARGERTFQRSYSCHSVDPNEIAIRDQQSLRWGLALRMRHSRHYREAISCVGTKRKCRLVLLMTAIE
jgi:hypothetical protein